MNFLLETGATKMTARDIWTRLEKEMAVGDCWQFDDGECCTVAALTHNGIEPAVICYQPRTIGRILETLDAHDQNPRSWHAEAAALIRALVRCLEEIGGDPTGDSGYQANLAKTALAQSYTPFESEWEVMSGMTAENQPVMLVRYENMSGVLSVPIARACADSLLYGCNKADKGLGSNDR